MTAQVEYLWWADCPSHEEGYRLLGAALAAEGLDLPISSIEVRSEAEAERLVFVGSPTFRVNGRDLDLMPPPTGMARPYGMTCRVYRREDGRIAPLPTLDWLRAALRRAVAE